MLFTSRIEFSIAYQTLYVAIDRTFQFEIEMMIGRKRFYVKCLLICTKINKIKRKLSTKKLHFGHFLFVSLGSRFQCVFFLTIMKCQFFGNSEISTEKKTRTPTRKPPRPWTLTHASAYAHTSHHFIALHWQWCCYYWRVSHRNTKSATAGFLPHLYFDYLNLCSFLNIEFHDGFFSLLLWY